MKNKTDESNFLTWPGIPVTLTYRFTDPPHVVKFLTRVAMDNETTEFRQAHFALETAAQEAGKHAYNVEMLARLTIEAPEGLPEFDKALEAAGGDDSAEKLANAIRSYLGKADNPMIVKIAADAMNLYFTLSQPKEFFR